jgi:CheY-like chemotaxis protein
MPSEETAGKTILVAEDDRTTREWLGSVLQAAGYQVILAANGQQALDLMRMGPHPDLIMLDMLMPVLDGWHFLSQLKRQTPPPPIPILIATATILTREWAQAQGCAGFIKKPFEAEQLLTEVCRCLAARRNGSPRSAHP